MEFKKIFNKNLLKYLGLGYVNVILNVAVNLLLLQKLSVSEFGKISLGKTIFQSFDFSHLGIRSGFDRIFPVEKDQKKNFIFFSTGLLVTICSSVIFVIFWLVQRPFDKIFYFYFSIAGLFSSIITLYRIYYRSFEDKKRFVQLSFLSILFPTIAQILGFVFFGFWGFVYAFITAYILVFLLTVKIFSIRLVLDYEELKKSIKELFNKGFLLYISSLIAFASTSADRFLIEYYWNIDAVGRFSAILFFFSVFTIFTVNYTEMFMNKIISRRSLSYTLKHSAIVLGLSILMVSIVFFIIEDLLQFILPQYAKDSSSIKIIILGVLPFSLRSQLYYYMHGLDKRKLLLFTDLLSSLIYFACLFYVLKNSKSIENIAFAKLSYYFINVIIIFIFALIVHKKSINEIL